VVWLVLAVFVISLGLHIVSAARQHALLIAAAHTALVMCVLYKM
jgi:hypothetical protein